MASRATHAAVPWAAVLLGALPVSSLLIGLGTLADAAAAWKEALIATIEQRIHAAPRAARRDRAAVQPGRRRRLLAGRGHGRLSARQASGISSRPMTGSPGFFVYTPLRTAPTAASSSSIAASFPTTARMPATRPQGQVDGRGDDHRPCPQSACRKAVLDGARQRAGQEYLLLEGSRRRWRRRPACRSRRGCCRSSSTPMPTPNPGGLPIGGVTIVDLPNSHLQYAVTWYGLAAALAGVLGVWLWRPAQDGQARRLDRAGARTFISPPGPTSSAKPCCSHSTNRR